MDSNIVLGFLAALKENNNREWFSANKKWYEQARKEAETFIEEIVAGISSVDATIHQLPAKDFMFRIFRDVRFGADKSPYKTNFGAFITPGGRKSMLPGYYLHFEPGESFLACGVYMPEPERLKKIRDEIYFNSAAFREILAGMPFRNYFPALGDFDKMKKAPRDYPADFPDIDLLKYRSYIVSHNFSDAELGSPAHAANILQMVRAAQPFMGFLDGAIKNG